MNSELGVLPKPIPFGKYCLLEKISVGGMAEVYKAKAFGVEGFERLLAVKKILSAIAEDETFISMFIDEAKIAGQLNHPNICSIFDLGKVDGSYFIALEYISGKDMRTVWDRMVRDSMTPDVFMASHMVMKVCEALQYAHTKRNAAGEELHIVHRDISPHNVLISHEGEAKIIDFGIAKAQGKSSQTQVGILKGKFSYMSPEQVRGLHIDHRADLFSLGIVLYELLTLQRLFLGESDFDTLEKIRKVEMSPPTLYNPHIPRELEDIVLKSLAKSPDDRFQSGAEFHDALQRFMRNQSAYFDQKDLSNFMKETFAADIELERKKLDYYRTINIDSLNGQRDANGLSWEEEELETHIFQRQATPPNHDEINPAAERGALAFDGDAAFSEPAFVGTHSAAFSTADAMPVADIVYKSGEFQAQEFAEEADPEDDPTMEFDRMRVINSVSPEIAEAFGPAPDILDAALENSAPPPLPSTVPMPPLPSGNPTFTGPAAGETMPPGMVVAQADERKGSSVLGVVLALFIIVILLAGLAAAAVVLYPKFMPAKTGAITFKISPAKTAVITIDDTVEYKGSTKGGVSLHEIGVGERKITIASDGYDTLTDTLTVESGQNYVLPISLEKAEVGRRETGVKITVGPAGATVSLNGDPLDQKPPFTKDDMKPGKATLVFRKDGFLDETREVDVEEGKITEVDVTLKPSLVNLTVQAEPKDAEVAVYEKDDPDAKARKRVKKGKGQLVLTGLDGTKVFEVEVNKRGFQPWAKVFVPAGESTKTLLAALTPKESEAAPTVDPAERERLRRMADKARKERDRILSERKDTPKDPVVVRVPKDDGPKDPVVKTPSKPKGFGVLNVSSKPAARVFIDGSDTGRYTPLLNYKIPAGKHRVILRNDEQGLRRVYNVDIKPNATKSLLNLPR